MAEKTTTPPLKIVAGPVSPADVHGTIAELAAAREHAANYYFEHGHLPDWAPTLHPGMSDRTATTPTAAQVHEDSTQVFILLEQAQAVAELIFESASEVGDPRSNTISSAAGAITSLMARAQKLQDSVMSHLDAVQQKEAPTADRLWPFETVSMALWARLTERQKGMVEEAANKALNLIEALNVEHPAAVPATSARTDEDRHG